MLGSCNPLVIEFHAWESDNISRFIALNPKCLARIKGNVSRLHGAFINPTQFPLVVIPIVGINRVSKAIKGVQKH